MQMLFEIDLYDRVARKKSYVNKINRGKRIDNAKMMMEKPYDYWKHVLWSDESKFNLFGSDGKIMVWRLTMEEYHPKCTVPTVKHDDGFGLIPLVVVYEIDVLLKAIWIDSSIVRFSEKICSSLVKN